MVKVWAILTGKIIIFGLILIIGLLIAVQLVLTNQLADAGGKLSRILSQIEQLERENRDLAVKIHQKGSISNLKELASSYGFVEPEEFFFVKRNFLVAENR